METVNVPLFPLNTVLFPGMVLPLHIFEERYKVMVGRCMEENLPFGVVLIRSGREVGSGAEPFEIGTLARIAELQPLPDGRYRLNAVGTQRFRIESLSYELPYLSGDVRILEDAEGEDDSEETRAAADTVAALFGEYFRLSLTLAGQWQERVTLPGDPPTLANFVAARLVAPMELKQRILEGPSTRDRIELILSILTEAIPALSESVRLRQQRRWSSISSLN